MKMTNKGFTLIEAVVVTALLATLIMGSMHFTSNSFSALNRLKYQTKRSEIISRIEDYLGLPRNCRTVFGPGFNLATLNAAGTVINNPTKVEPRLNGIYLDRDHYISRFSVPPLGLADPYDEVPVTQGRPYSTQLSASVVTQTAEGTFQSGFSVPIEFEVINDGTAAGTLVSCYLRSSTLVTLQQGICHQMGGQLHLGQCGFPDVGDPTEGIRDLNKFVPPTGLISLSQTLCDADRRVTLIQNEAIAAIANAGVTLVDGFPAQGAVTKYCKTPQGRYKQGWYNGVSGELHNPVPFNDPSGINYDTQLAADIEYFE